MGGRGPRLLAAVACALVLAACGGPGPPETGGGARLTVLAAASLTEVFNELGRRFETAHPGTEITFSFGSSATLASQITRGAPADVFAAASVATMASVVEAGAAADPKPFAINTLQIAVPRGNPGAVTGLADFADPKRRIALCAEQVPCGAAAAKVLAAAGVQARPDTYEADVKAAVGKVRLGEVDAALVYRTDVIAAGDEVEAIEVPQAAEAPTRYPIAVLAASRTPALAQSFVDLVSSDSGQAVLAEAGFGRP